MKLIALISTAIIAVAGSSLFAGPPDYKQAAPPPPPPNYGVGFYGAIDMGANVYQNRGENRTFTQDNPNLLGFGDTLTVDPKNDVGFFGGIKPGYVFGTGVVRPTVEGDFFYNGFWGGADFTLYEAFTACPDGSTVLSTRQANATRWINPGSFLGNFILRFAPGNGTFQPYVRAGVGIYFAESAGVEVRDPLTGAVPINTGGGANHADLAFDVVAGSDYFFTPNMSAFIEYKFLDYTSTQINTNKDRNLGQQLLGAGVRFFFH